MTPVPIPFAKTEAHGNDFLVVSEEHATDAPSELAIAMCDRLRGIGADGLILYRRENGRFVMTLFNSDGSSAEISGNGLRCLAAYLTYSDLVTGSEIEVETGAGLLKLSALGRVYGYAPGWTKEPFDSVRNVIISGFVLLVALYVVFEILFQN